jgi:Sulfotransferase family
MTTSPLESVVPRVLARLEQSPLGARAARSPIVARAGAAWPRTPLALQMRTLEPRLVWIFGSPRSGSTWLLQLLCHPLVPDDESPTGVRRLDAPSAGRPPAIPINEPYVQQHLVPTVSVDMGGQDGEAQATLQEFRHATPSYFLSDQYAGAWRPALRRLVLARLAAQVDAVARDCGGRGGAVVIKEPNGSIGAGFVMSLLPRSRMIFLLRDGRDVVDSMVDAQMPGGWLASPVASRAQELRAGRLALVCRESHLWLARTQAVKRAFDAHPEHLRCLVRYEDARRDTDAVLSGLEHRLGLRRTLAGHADALRWNDFDTVPAEAKGAGKPLRAATPGLWRENLSQAEQAAMAEIMGAQLAELGYD